ncbi:hypothetical protein [Baekduia sp. Peel2402]|uniref:hypothetical protein n=1 Tax=Baekduia sp. Peel2402 TaxID=3458296 RepID=UPI00403ED37D
MATSNAAASGGERHALLWHEAQAQKPRSEKAKSKTRAKAKARATPVKLTGLGPLGGVVPDWAIAAFATFEQPRAASIPRDLAHLFTGPKPLPILREQGIDYHEARQLDVAGRRFYLVPGRGAICLFYPRGDGSGAAVCLRNGPLAYLNGINVDLLPPPSEEQVNEWLRDRTKPYPVTGSPVVTIGVAPRGVTQVLLHAQPREERVAVQVGEGYVGTTKDIIYSRTFSGPGVLPYNSAPYTPLVTGTPSG